VEILATTAGQQDLFGDMTAASSTAATGGDLPAATGGDIPSTAGEFLASARIFEVAWLTTEGF
jgi:hypothetical protein